MKSLLLAVVPTSLAFVALSFGVLPAEASPGKCVGSSGVTVVVEYGTSASQVGCAEGDPSTGYQALTDAGFTITYAQGSGAGAICRINGYPSGNSCGAMPPANAYWAYYHGTPGSSWEYSTVGGGGYDPKPGTVEGWRFQVSGSTATPEPTPKATPKPSPRPTKAPAAAPLVEPVETTSPAPDAAPSAPDAAPFVEPVETPTTGPTGTATDDTLGDGPQVPSSAELDTYAAPGPVAGAAPASQSNSVSWVVGIGLAALLGTVGAVVALKRRQE